MQHPIVTVAKYTVLEAIKNRLFTVALIGLVCIFGLAQFAGELAVTETRQIQSGLAGFALRLAAVLLLGLFVITSVLREFQDKTVDLLVSLPLPRYVYYFGKLAGFCLLALLLGILMGLPLLLYAGFQQVMIWTISLICEIWMVTALSLLCLFTFGNVTSAFMSVAAFYILARSMATIQLLSQSPILESITFSQKFMNSIIDVIAYLLPGLHDFTRTEWLVYGEAGIDVLGPVFLQTLIYIILLSAVALFDLYRKNF